MTFKGVDHIVVRVKDLDAGIANWRDNFGLTLDRTSESVELGMKQAFFNLDNGGFIEVVAPLSDDSPVAKAIESRGEGLHVMAMEVEDRDATVKQLEANAVLWWSSASDNLPKKNDLFSILAPPDHALACGGGRPAAAYGIEQPTCRTFP